jgi:hypothetical protein
MEVTKSEACTNSILRGNKRKVMVWKQSGKGVPEGLGIYGRIILK